MIHKTTIYRRKFRGFFTIFLFSLLIFIGVFLACFGIWFLLHTRFILKSPLAKSIAAKNSYVLSGKLQQFCMQYHLNCTAISINGDNTATVIIDTDERVFFSLQKDLTDQFASLQLTKQHLTIEGKRFSRLDFRFDKPVISY